MTAPPVSDSLSSAPCVLVVDDNAVNLRLAEILLKERGALVHTASSAQEALSKVWSTRYALVLMDIHMAGEGGISAVKEIRALGGHCSSLPILAFTADNTPHVAEACRAAGMDGFIAKPLDIQAFESVLERWCQLPRTSVATTSFTELRAAVTPENFGQLVTRFLAEAPQQITRLQAAAARQDHEAVGREAHTLKSLAALFGLAPLQNAAAEIERRAFGQEISHRLLVELSDLVRAACVWLERQIGAPPTNLRCKSNN